MTIKSQVDNERTKLLAGLTAYPDLVNHVRREGVIAILPNQPYPNYQFEPGQIYIYTQPTSGDPWALKGTITLDLRDLSPLDRYLQLTASTLRCTFTDQAERVVVAFPFGTTLEGDYGSRIYTYDWVEGGYQESLSPFISSYRPNTRNGSQKWEGIQVALSSSGKTLASGRLMLDQYTGGYEESCVILSETSNPPEWFLEAHHWKDLDQPDGWFETIIIPRLDEIEAILADQPTPLT
jgi:hypothetical protein